MKKEKAIKFAGLMEDYLNIPSFICEAIEKDLEDNKYKETIEYVINRRNEIESKEDYISEQQLVNKFIKLQSNWDSLREWLEILINSNLYSLSFKEPLRNVLDKMNELEGDK